MHIVFMQVINIEWEAHIYNNIAKPVTYMHVCQYKYIIYLCKLLTAGHGLLW